MNLTLFFFFFFLFLLSAPLPPPNGQKQLGSIREQQCGKRLPRRCCRSRRDRGVPGFVCVAPASCKLGLHEQALGHGEALVPASGTPQLRGTKDTQGTKDTEGQRQRPRWLWLRMAAPRFLAPRVRCCAESGVGDEAKIILPFLRARRGAFCTCRAQTGERLSPPAVGGLLLALPPALLPSAQAAFFSSSPFVLFPLPCPRKKVSFQSESRSWRGRGI